MNIHSQNSSVDLQEETQLIQRCLEGETQAFEKLFAYYRPQLFYYFLMRYADFYEAEDDTQEVLLGAFENIADIPAQTSFLHWIFKRATQLSQAKLKTKTPWSLDALEILQEQISAHPVNEKLLQEIYQDYEESYQIIDHILFCFIVMSKTQFVEEQENFLLAELYDFSPKEIVALQDLPSSEVKNLEKKLHDTQEDLAQIYFQRCSLVKRDGLCTQCQDYGRWLEGEDFISTQLEALKLSYSDDALESFDERLDLLRARLKQKIKSSKFHQKLFDFLRLALGEKGLEEDLE